MFHLTTKHDVTVTVTFDWHDSSIIQCVHQMYDMNMFDHTCLALISDVDQDIQMFGSDQRSLTYRYIIS